MAEQEFLVDPSRARDAARREAGIRLRAKHENKLGKYDISKLDRASLVLWLRSEGGGENAFSEKVVLALLGYERLAADGLEKIEGDEVDRASMIRWLRSEGAKNALAENVAMLLLGHERLTDAETLG